MTRKDRTNKTTIMSNNHNNKLNQRYNTPKKRKNKVVPYHNNNNIIIKEQQKQKQQQQQRQNNNNSGKIITIGKCLGKGGFSKVFEIIDCYDNNKSQNEKQNRTTTSTILSEPRLPVVSSLSSLFECWIRNKKEQQNNMIEPFCSPSNNNVQNKNQNQPKTKKKFALKILRNSTLRKSERFIKSATEDLYNELQILSHLNHKNIIRVHNNKNKFFNSGIQGKIDKNNNMMFLVIDQLDYTLDKAYKYGIYNKVFKRQQHKQFDNNNRYNWRMILKGKINIALQIVNVLKYIHRSGYVYRDLKEQNIGLVRVQQPPPSSDGSCLQVKLFDFGLSRKVPNKVKKGDHTNSHGHDTDNNNELYNMTIVGSPGYMSPELCQSEKYNQKVDVYSWSVVFYTMLANKKPPIMIDNHCNDIGIDTSITTRRRQRRQYRERERNNNNINSDENDENHSFFGYENEKVLSSPEQLQYIIENSWKSNVLNRWSISKVHKELTKYYHDNFN